VEKVERACGKIKAEKPGARRYTAKDTGWLEKERRDNKTPLIDL
jgi:hypothetical protein